MMAGPSLTRGMCVHVERTKVKISPPYNDIEQQSTRIVNGESKFQKKI